MTNPMNDQDVTAASDLPDQIWRWDAVDVAAHIRRGTISSHEALQSCYARTDALNPRLNAIVHADRERALLAANTADSLVYRGETLGPLHGVPVTIKLNVDVQGEATTNGVPAFAERIAPGDSTVVSNLLKAGAINVGRTNTPPFSFRWFTENPLHGRTLNPWDETVTSGGSSGGAGVSVAAGMCSLAHGTDIAGSIRYPAYVNGLAGLRTTPGRIPAFHPTTGLRFLGLQTMSAQGPLARRMRDLRLGLVAMSGADRRDPLWVPAQMDYPDDSAPVRVALVDEIPGSSLAPEIKIALNDAAQILEAAGYMVERATPPGMAEGVEIWQSIVMTEARMGMFAGVKAMGDDVILRSVENMLAGAPAIDLEGYALAIARRDQLRRQWNEFMSRYPLILLPTSCRLPMRWGADLGSTDDMKSVLADQSPLITVAALCLPGLNVPTGVVDGLPIGVQLVADSYREQRLLAAGSVIERAVDMPNLHDRF
ncbi:amidase family protein [Pseudomonas sp. REP124]|uniref:amidase family protein n=1 Tax=Pseudomonas sp. REP124 TaxID=2875731 RepID=UPI001CCD71CA|nr:amidase family protein [Pseudomonas sp. REP124]MBZ9783026.1 amidase family protein [Pseudomonas sp. REP124]